MKKGKTYKVTVPENKGAAIQTIWDDGIIAEPWKTKTFQDRGPAAHSAGNRGPPAHRQHGRQNKKGKYNNKSNYQQSNWQTPPTVAATATATQQRAFQSTAATPPLLEG